jgi:type III secretion protein L
VRTPLNRPTVLALARVESLCRIIPASRVAEIERIAIDASSASQRIQQVETRCLEDLDKTTHAAWQRGYSRGHAEALGKLREYLTALDARKQSVDAELIALVAEAVSKIVRNLPPTLLTENLIEAALSEARGEHGRLTLHVHPECLAQAEEYLRNRAAADDEAFQITIEADAALAREDCTLETPSGRIEAGLQTQLDALNAVLRQQMVPVP